MNQETRSRCFRFSSPRSAGTDQRPDCREFANSALKAWQVPLFLFSLPEAGPFSLHPRHPHTQSPTFARSPATAQSPVLFRRGASAEHLLNLQWRIGAQSATGAKRLADCVTNAIVRLKQLLDDSFHLFLHKQNTIRRKY